jgi:N utilization substance protein B
MISRRNIRVKVMQALYAAESQQEPLPESGSPSISQDAHKLLQRYFDQSRALLVYLIYFITEVSLYTDAFARQRASKHLPTAEDLRVNTKLAGNELLLQILELKSWKAALKREHPEALIDREMVRKIFLELHQSETYTAYIGTEARDKKQEKAILEFILSGILLPNESFITHLEELFPNWDDDAEMMVLLVNNFFSKLNTYDFSELISREKKQFAFSLLETVLEKKEQTLEFIRPKLKNWDPDRIAILDMILMRMGVCEFLFFETIPPKVTINEYIDLAKEYSTPQSGQFVNGILDNIHKDLVKDERMHKVAFKPNIQ